MNSSPASVEALLAALPIEARSVSVAPNELSDRVAAIPNLYQPGTRRGRERWLILVTQAAAVVVVAAIVSLGLVTFGQGPSGFVEPSPPASTPFDPSLDGQGIVAAPADTLSWAPWLIAGGVVALCVVVALRRGRKARTASALVAIAALGAAFSVATQDGPVFMNGWGAPVGIQTESPLLGSDGPDMYYVTALPGDNFIVTLNVQNQSSLPLRVLGVVEELPESALIPRWTAVGMLRNEAGEFLALEFAQPFRPIELGPGQGLNLYLAGRAGACALGRPFDLDENLGTVGRNDIPIAFSVLGMTSVAEVAPPFVVREPQAEACEPGFPVSPGS